MIFKLSSNRSRTIRLICMVGTLFAVSSMAAFIDPDSTLQCHLREYTHKVYRKDSLGRKCWDTITVLSCWGRCDSYEIADWQFPFKISHHPVCMHGERKLRKVDLRHCEANVEAGTSIYEFYEAAACTCQMCSTSYTNCQGLRYHVDSQLRDILR